MTSDRGMSVPPSHRIGSHGPQSVNVSVMSAGSLLSRGDTASPSQKQTFPRQQKRVHLEEIHGEQQATVNCFFKRSPRAAAPWEKETLSVQPLGSVGQTQTGHSPLQSGKCHRIATGRVYQGGHCLYKAKVGRDSRVTQTVLPRPESPGAPSKADWGSTGPGWALRLRIFNQLPGNADAAGLWPTL